MTMTEDTETVSERPMFLTPSTTIPTSYQGLCMDEEGEDPAASASTMITTPNHEAAHRTLWNFTFMSILFSANHGCVVACLALATARLGSTGAWQSGILYLTYTGSALLGATYIVKRAGARNAIWLGMALYCIYVACFWVATRQEDGSDTERLVAFGGAAIGGVGAGFLWTAQGAYFAMAADEHAHHLQQDVSISTASLAGRFAFLYLAEEVVLRVLSTVLVGILSWESIFGLYTAITVVSTLCMPFVYNYPPSSGNSSSNNNDDTDDAATTSTIFYKVTAAGQLLWKDPKMKYMIGLNAVFGFASAFLNSYVNGQVVPIALVNGERYIGVLSSWVSAVAAGMSLVFGRLGRLGKGPILLLGACCFLGVVLPFVVQPDASHYGWGLLIMVYSFHGIGRATFEGTLKATFADYFPYEKEGAFANIILQNGLSGAIGYFLTFSLLCDTPSRYCIEYNNGTLHDVLTFELIVVVSAIIAIVGYLRASLLYQAEQQQLIETTGTRSSSSSDSLLGNETTTLSGGAGESS